MATVIRQIYLMIEDFGFNYETYSLHVSR